MADTFGLRGGRLPFLAAMVVALGAALFWLQGRFDASDVKKGIALAMGHRPRARGPSLFEALASRDEGDPRCDGKVVSVLFGDVQVTCATPGRPDIRYEFRVLLDGRRPPRGESETARALLEQLAGAPAAPRGAGR